MDITIRTVWVLVSVRLVLYRVVLTALGSGIYSPSGPLNFTYNTTRGSELVVAQVPILSAPREARPRLSVGSGEVRRVEFR